MGRVLRGLLARRGSTLLLLVLTVVAVAAAAAAPAYEQAARTSILQTTLTTSQSLGSQLEVTDAVNTPVDPAAAGAVVEQVLRGGRSFAAPVLADEATDQVGTTTYNLVSRTGSCADLHLLSGRCPTRTGEVLQGALDPGFHRSTPTRIGGLTVVGTYAVPAFGDPTWFGRYDIYFPAEGPDALFASQATARKYGGQAFVVVDVALRARGLTAGGLAGADRAVDRVLTSQTLSEQGYTSVSLLDATVTTVHQGWSALAIPTVLATAELLLLVWLMLSLLVVDDIEARAPEVALAKLRGRRPASVLAVAVGEPLAILTLAVPVGAVLGLLVAHLLAHANLQPGTPVGLPALSWAAAAAAVLGGVAAVLASSRRVLRRGVLEQWRRTTREAPTRGWVIDAILLTGAAAGLGEVIATGAIGSSSHGLQVELVPGLIALAASVVLSRLLPPGCRLLARLTARRGSLAPYLALRQIGRRSGGTRTTIVLASSVAVALFGVAAFSVGHHARSRVAAATVGAPTVLTVEPPQGVDLAAVVDRVDPSGRRAVAVSIGYGGSGNLVLAVDPSRFAAVASWSSPAIAAAVAHDLDPTTTAPTVLTGSAVRLGFSEPLPPGAAVGIEVSEGGGYLPVTLTGTRGTYSGLLTNCPCTLGELTVEGVSGGIGGHSVLTTFAQRTAAGWVELPGAVTHWQVDPDDVGSEKIAPRTAGLSWTYETVSGGEADLLATDRPDPLPAVTASPVGSVGDATPATGLDGQDLLVVPVAVTNALPGSPDEGVVVDRTLALRASGGADIGTQQIWLARGAQSLEPALRKAGVQIQSSQATAALRTSYDRAGPALSDSVLLLDAGIAAALAVLGATTVLLVAARRRRYEYASLIVGGASRATVWRVLVLEQAITSGYAVVIGAAAGVAGIVVTLRKVPVLQPVPVAPPLDLAPPVGILALTVLGAIVVIGLAAALSATALVRSVRPGTLRETQQ
jgi:putative ABC transport system permease protein